MSPRVRRPRAAMTNNICLAVWNATGFCKGWTDNGHHLHGCSKHPGHRDTHVCKCGSRCAFGNDLPLPKQRDRR